MSLHDPPFDHLISRTLRSGLRPRPDSDGPDSTTTTLRSGRAPIPDPDSVGPPGPTRARPVTPTGLAPGTQGPGHSTVGLVPACATPPPKAIVAVLAPAPSRCRHVRRGPINRRATDRTGWDSYLFYGYSHSDSGTSSTPTRTCGLRAKVSAKVVRVHPSHPAAFRRGMRIGPDSPGQH